MISGAWIFASSRVTSDDGTEGLNPSMSSIEEVICKRNSFIIALTPSLISDFDVMVVFEEDESNTPDVFVIFKVDVLPNCGPIC